MGAGFPIGRLMGALLMLAYSTGVFPGSATQAVAQTAEKARELMVRQQIESRGVRDERVLEAMRSVPRHRFLPERLEDQAYQDHPVPIGHGQTISQPYIVAYMSELLDVEPDHRVLEIGTGSGYQAAVLSHLADEVYTIERVEALAEQARRRLDELGYDNVRVRYGDGYLGWPEAAPFDRIIVTAAPDELPQPLVDQLAPEGRLVAPVGPVYRTQTLIIVEKDPQGRVSRREDLPVRFVPMLEDLQEEPQGR